MFDKKLLLEEFEKQKEYMDKRISLGIEQNRKGWADITVTDKDGNPVSDVVVTVKQKSHEFKFGANLFMLDELETKEKNEEYKKRFAELFNIATLPFYWDSTEPEEGHTRYTKDSVRLYRRPPIDLCIEFCEKHNIEPREHALSYTHFFPDWLIDKDAFTIKRALSRRMKEISERYADKMPTIEVTNESEWDIKKVRDGRFATYTADDYMEWSFKEAEKYFPANQLAANEWGSVWETNITNRAPYFMQLERAMLKGARIDAIGMQYHMFYKKEDIVKSSRKHYNPRQLFGILDLYSRFNLPLQITEITIPAYSNSVEDEELQAEIISYLYKIWFSHKNVEQIIYWNMVDGYAAFAPQGDMTVGENYYYGGLIRFDMTPKPSYYALRDLITKEWHTEKTFTLAGDGKGLVNGFYGLYDVTIKTKDREITKEFNLSSKKLENKFSFVI